MRFTKEPTHNGSEVDLLYHRQDLKSLQRPGACARLKRNMRRRNRHKAKRQLRKYHV